jgi:uncharacterized Zn finger protein (UPF0148 family)
MSDFDAEAERERLREKYEAEEEDRKRTQQMSELLLKGATMTNAHCGECGSPIFRYEGQEFCPSCQRTTADDTATGDAAAGDGPTEDVTADGDAEAVGADATAGGAADGAQMDTPGANGAASNGVGDADAGSGTHRETAVTPGRSGADAVESRDEAPTEPRDAQQVTVAGETDKGKSGRETAHEALYAALTRHARLAADTDDPRQATEHLEAAREAAAAIDELGGA